MPFQRNFLLLAILGVNVNAYAEARPEPIEETIITGSRTVENIDEVPSSVVIINRDEIEKDMLVSTELGFILANQVPGLAPSTGTTSNSGQTLRGRRMLIMIDGVPQSTPLRNGQLGIRTISPGVIERIEVIKGATSIYGNGASGGIINYITKKPDTDKEFAGSVSTSTNFSAVKTEDSFGSRTDVLVNGTVDKFNYIVDLVHEDNGIYRDADGDALGLTYGLSDMESNNIFSKLGYNFDNNRSVGLTYNYYEAQQKTDYINADGNINNGIKSSSVKNTANIPVVGDPQGPRGNHNLILQYDDHEIFVNTSLTANAYWQEIENVFFTSTKFSDPGLGFTFGQSLIKSNKKGLRASFNTLFNLGDDQLALTYGLDLQNDVTSQPLVDGRIWVPEMDMDNIAGYLQAKYIFNDQWVLKAGLRKENTTISVDDFRTLMICRATCSTPVAVKGGELDYSFTTYNIGLRYSGNDKFSPFVSYSEGSDISDLGRLLRSTSAPNLSQIRTEASITKNTEIGFISKLGDWRLEFASYLSTSKLGTATVFDSTTGLFLPQRAPHKIWGFEGSADYQVNNDLKIGASYSWVEGKNEDTKEYLVGGITSPPKLTAYADYQLSDALNIKLSYLGVGSRKRFDKVAGTYSGTEGPVDSYNVFNLAGSYQLNNIKLFAGIDNLLNKDYFPASSQAASFTGSNIKGRGRSVTLGMKYAF